MMELFIVVTSNEGEPKMEKARSIQGALDVVGMIATNQTDPREVERVFSVNEFGQVTFYEVQYKKGKLILTKPEEDEEELVF